MKLSIYRVLPHQIITGVILASIGMTGCKKMITIDPPYTNINAANVYKNDATAAAVLTGIYTNMSKADINGGGVVSLSLFPGLSADELTLFDLNSSFFVNYYKNRLTSLNTGNTDFWINFYKTIFVANSAIEGLSDATTLTPVIKQQLLGEAKFIRAFCYFYLVNLYGDVPLVLGTNPEMNRTLPRSPKEQVYSQVITDLTDAQNTLGENYLQGDLLTVTLERIRPSRWAATALLARTYLYTGNYLNAEQQSTAVINHTTMYDTVSLNKVFLLNSKEAIWQLQPVNTNPSNTSDARLFLLPGTGPSVTGYPVYLSDQIISSFEAGDQRKTSWVGSVTPTSGTTYYFANKYKNNSTNPANITEYTMVLRLAEQYLIRAEARAKQNKFPEAQHDLNMIRRRAGLPNTTANDQPSLVAAILQERKAELFTEWGHRWFDLKRTGAVDAVMNTVAGSKATTWNSNWQWYPIPQSDIDKDPALVGHQNEGY